MYALGYIQILINHLLLVVQQLLDGQKKILKAVIWLAIKKKKPILLLTDEDYNENGMSGIFEKYKSSYETNIDVFNMIQNTITGWPEENQIQMIRQDPKVFPLRKIIFFTTSR